MISGPYHWFVNVCLFFNVECTVVTFCFQASGEVYDNPVIIFVESLSDKLAAGCRA